MIFDLYYLDVECVAKDIETVHSENKCEKI